MEAKKLKGREFIEALSLGYHELDRMREEIDRVMAPITWFLWFVNQAPGFSVLEIPVSSASYSSGYRWCVYLDGEEKSCHIEVVDFANGRGISRIYSSRGGAKDIRHWDIQTVYENLGILADKLREKFPGLEKCLQPFLDAAAVAERQAQKPLIKAAVAAKHD